MIEREEEIQKALSSSDATVRERAFWRLWSIYSRGLKDYFLRNTRNQEDAEDLFQTLYHKMHKHLIKTPLLPSGAPKNFLFESAKNLWIDWKRDNRRRQSSLAILAQYQEQAYLHTIERQIIEERAGVCRLILHLSNEWERELAILRWPLELERDEIVLLTGWSEKAVHNGLRRVERKLRKMLDNVDTFANTLSPWEKRLPSAGNRRPFSVSYLNVSPQNIEPDSLKNLLTDLQVRDLQQAQEEYIFLVRSEAVSTREVSLILTITGRRALKPALFDGESVDYLDYIPNFPRIVKEKGTWKRAIELTNRREYPSKLVNTYHDEPVGCDIGIWYFPTLQMYIHKPLTEEMIVAAFFPEKRTQHTRLYQVYSKEEVEETRKAA